MAFSESVTLFCEKAPRASIETESCGSRVSVLASIGAIINSPMAPASSNFLVAGVETPLRELLRQHLNDASPACRIAEIATLAEARTQVNRRFDLIIVDLNMLDERCRDWALSGLGRENRPLIVIFSSCDQNCVKLLSLNPAIRGFVHEEDCAKALPLAIETVLSGGAFFSPAAKQFWVPVLFSPDFFAHSLREA